MRILHINLFDYQGGAAQVAQTLMNGMVPRGHDVHIFAHHKTGNVPRVIALPFPDRQWQKDLLAKQRRQGLMDLYSAALLNVLEHPLFEQADVVHLHCINQGYFSYLLMPFLAVKPLVWTLHDPLAFTAGCLNTDFCDGWKTRSCSACPLDGGNGGGQRELLQNIKSVLYKLADFTVVCPSVWLEKQARESILPDRDIRLIYNGIDTDIFRPGDRTELRSKLNLPGDKNIIMFAAHGGFNAPLKGGAHLVEALKKLSSRKQNIFLVTIGAAGSKLSAALPVPHLELPYIDSPQLMADYYGAADIFVSPSLVENMSLTVCEASACGTPVVAFAVGGTPEIIIHQETGYLARGGDCQSLADGLTYFLSEPTLRRQAGEAARERIKEKFSARRMVEEYLQLYEELLSRSAAEARGTASVIGTEQIFKLVRKAKINGWGRIWPEFQRQYQDFGDNFPLRAVFTDRFFTACLQAVDIKGEERVFWRIISQWWNYRQMPRSYGSMPPEEQATFRQFCCLMRNKLAESLGRTSAYKLGSIEDSRRYMLCFLWWQVFFNAFSPLVLEPETVAGPEDPADDTTSENNMVARYMKLMVISMYRPYDAGRYELRAADLWNNSGLPLVGKVIITLWMINTPYYSVNHKDRQKLFKYAADICRSSLPDNMFITVANELINAFWRISYAGGDNREPLTVLGDFIVTNMNRLFPVAKIRPSSTGAVPAAGEKKKLRVGYLSQFFRSQAVSYYMVNRVIYHNRENFEVYIFALGDRQDQITELFKHHSDYFRSFPNLTDPQGAMEQIISAIVESRLDILIYPEIGLDPLTYLLAGLQLAPVQAALVGHGTTTGLSTIQYYISGDFESSQAQEHYREKLICLPRLGAAQYPPPFTNDDLPTRESWKIPAEAVVFVSCANGIKHPPERDALLMEILVKAPNTCLILKPFAAADLENKRLTERIRSAARAAGVENRLFIAPPLKHVVALLNIADIQLDTYPYGGWTTNLEALYMGLPIITQEGELARNRWGAGMLRALGITEGIAANETEYVEWAVRLAGDEELRKRIGTKIRQEARQILFDGAGAQAAYEEVLQNIKYF